MNNKHDGGAAFPDPDQKACPSCHIAMNYGEGGRGMSLRDWYKGMALQGMATRLDHNKVTTDNHIKGIALYCAALADAMLKERDK